MNFLKGEAVADRYDEITEVYAAAFAGDPWYEVSRCPDPLVRCAGGYSALAVGALCGTCQRRPEQPASTKEELVDRFEELRRTRPTQWYLEDTARGLSLAALAWPATPAEIAVKKYADEPAMAEWLEDRLGSQTLLWLDEVFADKRKKASGNLANFAAMCRGFGELLGGRTIAYRTITPQMVRAARRFGGQAEIDATAPDSRERTFITINL